MRPNLLAQSIACKLNGGRVAAPTELAALEQLKLVHGERVAAAKREHAAGARRQKEFLRSIGVPDLSPEEVTERARAAQGRHVRDGLAERHP